MPRGGRRKGAGRPKGSKEVKTLEKEAAREHLRQRVIAEMDGLLDAQFSAAKGIKYLVVREKSGKFTKLTKDQAGIKIASGDEILELWEERPSTPAFTDLMNRALDKPVEQIQAQHTGGISIRWKGDDDD